jgi:flagellar biosynthetic protein FliS
VRAYQAYQQNRSAGQTRIDTILSLYEAILERLERARAALRRHDSATAQKELDACAFGISGLSAAFNPHSGELALSLMRLYDFAVRCLGQADEAGVEAALNTLRTLYEAFAAIRPEAVHLERSGQIPPLAHAYTIQARA